MKPGPRRNMCNEDYWRIVRRDKLVYRWVWRKSKSSALRSNRSDDIGPHQNWDPTDRGAIRARERATLRPARNWREVFDD